MDQIPLGFQTALAIALIKSKPPTLSVRDYITSLKPYIKRLPTSAPSEECNLKYLDATSYWKDLHRQSHSVVEQLEDELAEQRFQVESLRLELAQTRPRPQLVVPELATVPESPSPSNAGRKRVNDSNRQSPARKRRTVQEPAEVEATPEDDLSTLHPDIDARTRELFVRNIELRKLIDENNIFRAFDLALSLQRTASTVGTLLGRASTSSGVQMDESMFRLLALSINNLLQALGRLVLHRLSPDQEIQNPIGAAVYAIVHLFRSGLDALGKASRVEVEHRSKVQPVISDSAKKTTTRVDSTASNTVVYIRDTLETIITSVLKLQPAQGRANTKSRSSPHSDLLEGIQYVLITTAGGHLSTLTFGNDTGLDIDEEDLDAGLTAGTSTTMQNSTATPVRSHASAESNHVFQLLRLALSTTPLDSLGRKKAKSKNQETTLQRAMTGQPLLRLQHTLIQAVFGVTEDDDLEETLRLPAEVVLRKRGSKAREEVQEDGGEVFVKSMFELIGWEYLAKVE